MADSTRASQGTVARGRAGSGISAWTPARLAQTAAMFLVMIVLGVISGREFIESRSVQTAFYPGKGVTSATKLSAYLPNLKGTAGDSDVFILDSGNPGGTVLVMGGTHPDEPSGHLAAVVLLENAVMARGRMIVVPQAHRSGFTHTAPLEGYPARFTIKTPNGDRLFRFGSRPANPLDQWPDPDIYVHKPSGQRLSGDETRNLNRSYPGRPNGVFTERVAYAIKTLIIQEKADVTIDLHEAPLENAFINAIAVHERSREIGIMATINLSMENIQMGIEASPPLLHGLTHRELGDFTTTLTFLMETPNPIEGRLRGRTDENLILTGKDKCYVAATKLKRTFISLDESGQPISLRVGRHITGIREILNAYNDQAAPELVIEVTNLPSYESLVDDGVGNYLNAPGD